MIPGQFDYVRPSDLGEALQILADREGEAKVLSGGYSLIPLLKHQNMKIVIDTASVLGQLHYRDGLPELEKMLEATGNNDLKQTTLQAISRIGDPSSENIMKKYFSSGDKTLRQYAVEGFGRMKLESYLDPLKREFQREDSRRIKLAICFSLFALGD